MSHGLDNSTLYSAVKIKSKFFRESSGDKASVEGTGFFVNNTNGKWCLVTNRHVVDYGYNSTDYQKTAGYRLEEIDISLFASELTSSARDLPKAKIGGTLNAEANPVTFSPDYNNDVATIIDPQFIFDRQDVRLDYVIQRSVLADSEWINEKLSVCDFVAFPGFPPWHDMAAGRPIFRTGTIASDPRANYSYSGKLEGDRIAYEAFSFEGSSGSPVFALRKSGINSGEFREVRLIGINAGHLDQKFQQHSGISYFYKSSVILQIIESATMLGRGN
ncbi:trypsin-like peptidase domain-containing protein [Burkholderia gladioli]|uniref:trypsin-like peptidase domain-containing protein n=1 Tax=Burkholderia gladioli TaxID=28095 RepID=UPI00163F8CC3|nr:trypsin-like peptidase domain-containing protein [Burkholderia gladioli]